ncbi:MAG: DUF2442 domain-containing protein [Candidatus Omnitrophota bacterium]
MIKVNSVKAKEDYILHVRLSNGKEGLFDVKPYLEKGIFTELKDKNFFELVKPAFCGIVWPHEQDFSADTIECEMQSI